ncbi:MAG: PEP-CTERM sorting domain-containing protein [Armatimonadetes bacterium]|nr:MAG: PEP-CTERM sorting domain-containing protein [Armatimonadota bacterium]
MIDCDLRRGNRLLQVWMSDTSTAGFPRLKEERIMNRTLGTLALAALAAASMSQGLMISFGTRETGTSAAIGENGGTSGGIEWVNLDGQTLHTNSTWQLFTFTMATDPLTAFAGTTANGVLDGVAGTIENIRIKNTNISNPIRLWIDDVTDTLNGTDVYNFGTFEGYADGQEVMFQEPNFSGSTASHLVAGGTAKVDNSVSHSGNASYRLDYQYVDGTAARWLRLTTHPTTQPQAAPTIRYDQSSVVSFWMKAEVVPEPSSMIALGLGAAALLRRRRK